MKNIILFVLTFFIVSGILAQDSLRLAKRKKEIENKLVLVVPFNPILYNNEASKEMIEQTQHKYKQVQNIMRLGLDKALHKVIADSSLSKSLLESYTTQSEWDELEYIYANCDYFFDQAMSWEPGKKTLFGKSNLSSDKDIDKTKKNKKKVKKEKSEEKSDGELRSDIKNNPDKFSQNYAALCRDESRPTKPTPGS